MSHPENEQELIDALNAAYRKYWRDVAIAHRDLEDPQERVKFYQPALTAYLAKEKEVIASGINLMIAGSTYVKIESPQIPMDGRIWGTQHNGS